MLFTALKTSVIPLESQTDILDKLIYTICNPVQAQLVAKADNWPGLLLYNSSHSNVIKRPDTYFKNDGDMPDNLNLKIEPPPSFEKMSPNEYSQLIEEEVRNREIDIREDMRAKGQTFLGIQAVMAQVQSERPNTKESRFTLNPLVAAKNKWQRIEALRRNN